MDRTRVVLIVILAVFLSLFFGICLTLNMIGVGIHFTSSVLDNDVYTVTYKNNQICVLEKLDSDRNNFDYFAVKKHPNDVNFDNINVGDVVVPFEGNGVPPTLMVVKSKAESSK